MKITKLHLKNYQQFKDLTLDFTHPKSGEPLKRVCFIGKNGTGKTTILNQLNAAIKGFLTNESFSATLLEGKDKFEPYDKVKIEFTVNDSKIELDTLNRLNTNTTLRFLYQEKSTLNSTVKTQKMSINSTFPRRTPDFLSTKEIEYLSAQLDKIEQVQKQQNVLAYIVAENGFFDEKMLKGTVNDALALFKNFPTTNILSNDSIKDFWVNLIYHIKKRENDRNEFEYRPENLNRTKKELIEAFNKTQPEILAELAQLWDKILNDAGLYFDYQSAQNPIQLTDNLLAYIKHKETKERIPYQKLSSGIKNFIFRLGHLQSLYFNRKIDNGFVLIDEPENSLYPDFLYDLMEVYQGVTNDETQFFVATHHPIIAAQFEPYERFVLDFNERGYVTVRRGTAPIGDDPNDVLTDDFLVQNIMPKQGIIAWNRYKSLKKEIRFLSRKGELVNGQKENLEQLMKEMSEIGRKYRF